MRPHQNRAAGSVRACLVALAATSIFGVTASAQCEPEWYAPAAPMPRHPMAGEVARRFLTRVEGGREYLYIAGDFFPSGKDSHRPVRLLRYDGARFEFVDGGPTHGQIGAITEHDMDVVLGGVGLDEPPEVATLHRWDGGSWSTQQLHWLGEITKLTVFRGDIWAGGLFHRPIDPLRYHPVLRVGAGAAQALQLPPHFSPPLLFGLTSWNDTLVIAGYFAANVGTGNPENVLVWDGSTIKALNPPYPEPGYAAGTAYTIEEFQGELHAVVEWLTLEQPVGGATARQAVRWTGERWAPISPGEALRGLGSTLDHDELLSLGDRMLFTGFLQGRPELERARWENPVWDGLRWSPLTPVPHNAPILDAAEFDSRLFIAPSGSLLTLGENRWRAPGPGISAGGHALATYQGALVASLVARDALGNETSGVARLQGRSWVPVGDPGGVAFDLAEHDGFLYAVIQAGDSARTFRGWDGQAWSTLPSPNHPINSLVVHQGNLYATFWRTTQPAFSSPVARWDGTAWQPTAASAISGFAWLRSHPDGLLAGGSGQAVYSLQSGSWELWHALPPAGRTVDAIRWRESDIIAGTYGPAATISAEAMVLTFDGTSWVPLGEQPFEPGYTISGLIEWHGDLVVFAAGEFGSRPEAFMFDGDSWSVLSDDNVPAMISDMMVLDNRLVVAGQFASAGSAASPAVAFFGCPPCPADLTTTANPALPGYGVPDRAVNPEDFLYFFTLFSAADPRADLTSHAIPGAAGYAVPDGRVGTDDFFYFLTAYTEGC